MLAVVGLESIASTNVLSFNKDNWDSLVIVLGLDIVLDFRALGVDINLNDVHFHTNLSPQ